MEVGIGDWGGPAGSALVLGCWVLWCSTGANLGIPEDWPGVAWLIGGIGEAVVGGVLGSDGCRRWGLGRMWADDVLGDGGCEITVELRIPVHWSVSWEIVAILLEASVCLSCLILCQCPSVSSRLALLFANSSRDIAEAEMAACSSKAIAEMVACCWQRLFASARVSSL